MSSLRTASRIADRWRRRELATSFLSATLRDSLRLVHEAPPRKINGWFHLEGGAVLTPRGMGVSQRRANRRYSVASGVPPDGVCSAQDQRLVATWKIATDSVPRRPEPNRHRSPSHSQAADWKVALPCTAGHSNLMPSSQVRLALAADGKRDVGRE
jgi:hypothetical protein